MEEQLRELVGTHVTIRGKNIWVMGYLRGREVFYIEGRHGGARFYADDVKKVEGRDIWLKG